MSKTSLDQDLAKIHALLDLIDNADTNFAIKHEKLINSIESALHELWRSVQDLGMELLWFKLTEERDREKDV